MSSARIMILLALSACDLEDAIEDVLEYQHAYDCSTVIEWTCPGNVLATTTKQDRWCAYDREEATEWVEHVCRVNVEAGSGEAGSGECTAVCATTCRQHSEFCYE